MGPISILPVLGLAQLLSRRLGIGTGLSTVHALSLIILALYVAALADGLLYATLAIYGCGIVLFMHEFVRCIRTRRFPTDPVPLAVQLALSLAFWLRYGDTRLFFFDEYSHWGIYLKETIAADGLWGASTNAMHARYMPGPTLLQYYFGRFTANVEGSAFLAQFVFFLTPVLLLLQRLTLRQWPWIAGSLAVGLIAATQFSPGFSTLYVDHLLGAWFAGSLLAFFASKSHSTRIQALCALPLSVLVLVKGVGLAFALAAACIMILVSIWQLRSSPVGGTTAGRRTVHLLVALTVPAVVTSQLWTLDRDRVGARLDVMSSQTLVAGLSDLITTSQSSVGLETTRRFADVLKHTRLGNNEWFWRLNEYTYVVDDMFQRPHGLTALGALVAFTVWWLVVLWASVPPDERVPWLILAGGVLVTTSAYVASLYATYLFAFAERGILLPSYTRYVNTALIALLLVSFAPLLPGFRPAAIRSPGLRWWRGLGSPGALFLVGIVGLYLYERPEIRRVMLPNPPMEIRRQWEPLTQQVSAIVGQDRVWIYLVDSGPSEFMTAVLKFLLSPAKVHVERSAAFWLLDTNSAIDTLRQYDYVWVTGSTDTDGTPSPLASALGLNAGRLARIGRDARGNLVVGPAAPDDT